MPALLAPSGWQWRLCFCEQMSAGAQRSCCETEAAPVDAVVIDAVVIDAVVIDAVVIDAVVADSGVIDAVAFEEGSAEEGSAEEGCCAEDPMTGRHECGECHIVDAGVGALTCFSAPSVPLAPPFRALMLDACAPRIVARLSGACIGRCGAPQGLRAHLPLRI
ncbi:MAG: hypothetical protein FJ298_14370 [Planctomycetes bacterium]|nr:hypothetical protein [Planctomycetota bacterium]